MNLEWYSGKNILVTGGTGYIGSALKEKLSESNLWDYGHHWDLVIDEWMGFDVVFHLAAQTSVWKAEEDVYTDWLNNVYPMIRMLEKSKKTDHHPPIIFAGTATMFGIPTMLPVTEDHWYNPLTIYDIHKVHAYDYLNEFVGRGWAKGCMLILPNVYGPSPARSKSKTRGVLNAAIRKAVNGEPITLYTDCVGWRDWLYIDDAVEAFLCAGSQEILDRTAYVVGTHESATIGLVFDLITAFVEYKCPENKVPMEKKLHPNFHPSGIEQRMYAGDPSRFCQATGWMPATHLAAGIHKTVDWMLANG